MFSYCFLGLSDFKALSYISYRSRASNKVIYIRISILKNCLQNIKKSGGQGVTWLRIKGEIIMNDYSQELILKRLFFGWYCFLESNSTAFIKYSICTSINPVPIFSFKKFLSSSRPGLDTNFFPDLFLPVLWHKDDFLLCFEDFFFNFTCYKVSSLRPHLFCSILESQNL